MKATPTAAASPTRVRKIGVIGLGQRGWHHLERFRLREDLQIVAVTDASPARREQARRSQFPVVDTFDSLLTVKPLDGVLIASPPSERGEFVSHCLQAGLHVCLEAPFAENVGQARRWLSLAERCKRTLMLAPWTRWDPKFDAALAALTSGRLGALRAARLTVAEWSPWASDAPANLDPPQPPEQQFGPHGFDQLLQLLPGAPISISARRLSDEDGFFATFDFADGVFAQIDFRRRSRTGQSTGWILEGSQGSYRQGRTIAVSPDGELVDEPVATHSKIPVEEPLSWFEQAALAAGEPQRRRAWQSVGLIRAVTLACERRVAVRWDEVVGS